MFGWFDPTAFILPLALINATHFMWFNGTTYYVYQEGLSFSPASEAELQGAYAYMQSLCRYTAVKPLYVNDTSVVAEIWCSPDGVRWAWLRWLPLRLSAYGGEVEMISTNVTVHTAVGTFSGEIPAGWYNNGTAVVKAGELKPPRPTRPSPELEEALRRAQEAEKKAEEALRRAEAAETEARRYRELAETNAGLLTACQASLSTERGRAALAEAEAARLRARLAEALRNATRLAEEASSARATAEELSMRVAELEDTLASAETQRWLFLLAGAIPGVAALALAVVRRRVE